MQSNKTKAVVLRRTNFGEADRVVQFLLADGHKISAMARGVRREKSKLAGAVELLCISDVTVAKGKGDLHTLTSARLVTFYDKILQDYDRLQFAYDGLKKTGRLSEHIVEPLLFDTAIVLLESLNNPQIDLRIIKSWFFLRVADISGHGLNLSRDSNNQPLSVELHYEFDTNEMSFVITPKGKFSAQHLKLFKLLKLKSPHRVAQISGVDEYLDDITELSYHLVQ